MRIDGRGIDRKHIEPDREDRIGEADRVEVLMAWNPIIFILYVHLYIVLCMARVKAS